MSKKSVVLLSGGLDSLVSLDIISKTTDVVMTLTFNYGQKAFSDEKKSAELISKKYNVENRVVELPFLKEITSNALTDKNNHGFNDFNSVWVPNRNGLFLNVAACYCDKYDIDYVVFGANREEAVDFPDNSKEFLSQTKGFFAYSTLKKVEVLAPCLEMNKKEIIAYAIKNSVPLEYLKSCYNSTENTGKKHCGECMSCKLLKEALLYNGCNDLIGELF